MGARIKAELELLRLHFKSVEHVEAGGLHWFRVEPVRVSDDWEPAAVPAVFSVTQGHPGAPPYGFYVPTQLSFRGSPPQEHAAPHPPPFSDQWRFLSWQAVDWRPTADVRTGANLWGWVRSFSHRLREGK